MVRLPQEEGALPEVKQVRGKRWRRRKLRWWRRGP
jgi:hypothetical protein